MGVEVFAEDDHDVSCKSRHLSVLREFLLEVAWVIIGDYWIPCDCHLAHISSKIFVEVVT